MVCRGGRGHRRCCCRVGPHRRRCPRIASPIAVASRAPSPTLLSYCGPRHCRHRHVADPITTAPSPLLLSCCGRHCRYCCRGAGANAAAATSRAPSWSLLCHCWCWCCRHGCRSHVAVGPAGIGVESGAEARGVCRRQERGRGKWRCCVEGCCCEHATQSCVTGVRASGHTTQAHVCESECMCVDVHMRGCARACVHLGENVRQAGPAVICEARK
jgi:hypothetical protein